MRTSALKAMYAWRPCRLLEPVLPESVAQPHLRERQAIELQLR